MNGDWKLLGEKLLFPFELTTSDYLRRLFVCVSNGIRGPICYIVTKECVRSGLMESLNSFDSRDPVTLFRVLLGAYKVCGANEREVERHSFGIQSIFYTYIGNRKSYVHSVHTLLGEAIHLSLRECQMETGGKLPNMSITFEAARNLLESFAVMFDSCKIPLIHVIELQTQCEKHTRSKEERCIGEILQWPLKINSAETFEMEPLLTEKKQSEREKMRAGFEAKVSKLTTNSLEIFFETQKLLQKSEVYKYICLGRLNGMKSFIEVKISNAIKQRQLNVAEELRLLHIAIMDTAGVVGKTLVLGKYSSIEDIFVGKLEKMKLLATDLQLSEEDCLVLEKIELLSDLQSCRTKMVQLMLQMNDIIAAPNLKLQYTFESNITSDLLYTTRFNDGLSIEILSFKTNSVDLFRSVLRWPDITTVMLSSSQLDKLTSDQISDPLSLRLIGVSAYKLLRVGLTPLKLLKAGFSKFEIMESLTMFDDAKNDERGKESIHDDVKTFFEDCFESKKESELSTNDFGELLYALKADDYDAGHCLSVGYRLKDLLKAGFRGDECMRAIIEMKRFVQISARDSSTNAAVRRINPSLSVELSFELINSKLLRSLSLDCEKYALTTLYHALDGPRWRCKDNWLSEKPICEWYGVVCKDVGPDRRVIKLSLRGNMMTGKVPDTLCYLELLQSLDMGFNDINGSAYDILKLFPNVKDVWLENNERIIENVDYASKSRLKQFLQNRSNYNIRLDTVHPLKSLKDLKYNE